LCLIPEGDADLIVTDRVVVFHAGINGSQSAVRQRGPAAVDHPAVSAILYTQFCLFPARPHVRGQLLNASIARCRPLVYCRARLTASDVFSLYRALALDRR
jgi:hypothetical protein